MLKKSLPVLTALLLLGGGAYALTKDSIHLPAATDKLISTFVTTDSVARFNLLTDGTMQWGSGSGAVDTVLARSAANTLQLPSGDSLDINGHNGSTVGLQLGGTLVTATAAELNRAADVSARVVSLATATSITEALHDGKILLLGGAGSSRTMTLPEATGSGAVFRFIVGAVNTSNYVITKATNDTIDGSAVMAQDVGDTIVDFEATGTNDTITLNGTTKGGQIGDECTLTDTATDQYTVKCTLVGTGTEASPFSG